VNVDHPAKTPQELIAWLRANPTKVQFGSPGAGALPHFFGLLVGRAAGVEMTHIAYKGTPPSLTDLMAGQIPMATSTTSEFVELHRAGKIRVIATSGKERLPQLPDVPTFLESGIDIVGLGWYGIFAPAKTPEAVISRLNKALVAALAQPDMQEKLQIFGLTPTGTTPQELAANPEGRSAIVEPRGEGIRLHRRLGWEPRNHGHSDALAFRNRVGVPLVLRERIEFSTSPLPRE
jgi:tripartite-type tricarboxylate transporter receptor subunit TctC